MNESATSLTPSAGYKNMYKKLPSESEGKNNFKVCSGILFLIIGLPSIYYIFINPMPEYEICAVNGQELNVTEFGIILKDAHNHVHRSNQFTSNMTLECSVKILVPPEFLEDSRYQITMQFLKFEVDAYNTTACRSYLEIEDKFYCGTITGDSGVFRDAGFEQYEKYDTEMTSLNFRWFNKGQWDDREFQIVLAVAKTSNNVNFFSKNFNKTEMIDANNLTLSTKFFI
ncbi:Oidioi.mRNA.OKI2018_I69.chr2.g4816.t1.cds [Oikopleura dioica]|uniref:Oidioi.mRNA.OKI2018_I69.chr2.g4816.t1.cds n=1 Tax=Oikopleura dioica TaxID=34765 RepID=A0ABN7SYG7_OIKDI|nr:Oidioi.mRNA.OKI2018_I69.chr2.g4816.t1.cds [Oikopleura dioica]